MPRYYAQRVVTVIESYEVAADTPEDAAKAMHVYKPELRKDVIRQASMTRLSVQRVSVYGHGDEEDEALFTDPTYVSFETE